MQKSHLLTVNANIQPSINHQILIFDHHQQIVFASETVDKELLTLLCNESNTREQTDNPISSFYSDLREVLVNKNNRRGILVLTNPSQVKEYEYSLQYSYCPITNNDRATAHLKQMQYPLSDSEQILYQDLVIHPIFRSSLFPMCICCHSDGRVLKTNSRFSDLCYATEQKVNSQIFCWDTFVQYKRAFSHYSYWHSIPFSYQLSMKEIFSGQFSVIPLISNSLGDYLFLFQPQTTEITESSTEIHPSFHEVEQKFSRMAGGLGHEVRNALTVLSGYLEVLKDQNVFKDCPEVYEIIQTEVERSKDLTTDLLQYSSLSRERTTVYLHQVIRSFQSLFTYQARIVKISLVFKIEETPPIFANENDVRQIIMNLFKNAYESMENGGTITVEFYATLHGVCLAIKDEGTGIPEHLISQITEPYVTTKEKGTGLGLPICYEKVHANKGQIYFRTSASGTCFFVFFPIHHNYSQNESDKQE